MFLVIVLVVLLALVVLIALWVMTSYNGLVKLRNRIEAAWAQIEVQLKRRHDLVPNLVETVKGYAAHEKDTLDAVISARNSAVDASSGQDLAAAENGLTGALRQVFALSEAYPDLKANQNFLQLQNDLSGTEDQIASSRQYYNDTVRQYNTRIATFPAVILARSAGFTEREYFEADDGSRGSVQVSF